MRTALLDILVCPACHGGLACTSVRIDGDDIRDATLRCAACDREYPVVRGIPRFVPSENYAASFGYQWNRFRQEQVDSLNGIRQSETRFRNETRWTPEWMRGRWVLDAGCGAGRFLEVASRVPDCDCVGIDLSNAVDAASETLADRRNVHLVQASIFDLPFRRGTFDGVYCIGVIQHTPDPARATASICGVVRPGGRVAVTIYERRAFTMLYSKYWARVLTRRFSQPALLRLIKILMPPAFVLTEVLFRLPIAGRFFKFTIPVANYVDDPELSFRQRYQWAILDTFDMLAPAYDLPQKESDVVAILEAQGIGTITRLPNPGLNLAGVKTTAVAG